MYDIVIIGAGTAGLSAAIYIQRAGKSALLLEELTYGGQIVNAAEVANYPGIKKISGFDFAAGLYAQAEALGAELRYETALEISADGKSVLTDKGRIACRAVIIASGTKTRKLGLPHEEEWTGSGISYCATCDGAFFKGRSVAVNGGGSTALQDALFLSNYCSEVFLIHRRDSFRGERELAEKLKTKENISLVMNSRVSALKGESSLEAIELQDVLSGQRRTIPLSGLFIAVGREPNNRNFKGCVELDERGFIVSGEDCRTSAEGIFAAGDCRTKNVRQLVTAASDGAVAGLEACKYIG